MENKVELKLENKVENNDSTTVVAGEVSVATKKITVQEFVDTYKKTPERQRESYLKSLVITDYVPFEMKVALMFDLVQKTHMDNGNVSVKSPLCYALFMNLIVGEYLAVEIDKNNQMKDFNMMNKARLFDALMFSDEDGSIIDENELEEFKMVLDMVKSDFMTNNFSTHAFVSEQMNRIVDVVKVLIEPIVEELDSQFKNVNIVDLLKRKMN